MSGQPNVLYAYIRCKRYPVSEVERLASDGLPLFNVLLVSAESCRCMLQEGFAAVFLDGYALRIC